MQKESRKSRLSSRMLAAEDIQRERMKFMEVSTRNLQMKAKQVPAIYTAASLVLNFMRSQKLNLHEACDKVALIEKTKEISTQVEDLVRLTLYHEREINFLIKKVKLLEDNLDLDPFMLKVAIAEILWGKLFIKFNTMDTIHLRYYEPDIREAFVEATMIFDSVEDSYSSKLPVYIRINTLAISLEGGINAFYEEGWNFLPRPSTYPDYLNALRHLQGHDCIRDFHISELLVFPAGTSFYKHRGFLDGKFVIQDKGSCLSTFLLNPKPGSRVLDMCAAPGLTTNHIANMIKNEGIIYACDRHPDRYNRLCSLMDLTNVMCVDPIHDDCFKIQINDLNYILVDVPSTYTGIFHKKDMTGLPNLLRYFRHKSSTMLIFALQKFPTVKRVVYTSCSTFADEGEKIVADALKKIGDSYTLLDIREMLWKEWTTVGYATEYPFAEKCLRIKPEFDLCQSYFIAVFERNFSVPIPPYVKRNDTSSEVSKKQTCSKKAPSTTEKKTEPVKSKLLIVKKEFKKPRTKKKKMKIPALVQYPIATLSRPEHQYPPNYHSENKKV